MIKCYSGVPGSGKSLHAIRLILAYLKEGKNVIANFPVKVNEIKAFKGRYFYVDNDAMTVDFLYHFHAMYHEKEQENQTLIIVDEASVKFNCRTFIDKDRLKFCSFFAQHRKFGYNIVLISQNLRQVDRQIRDLVEIEIHHRKLNNFKFFKMLPFSLFVAIEKNNVLKEKNEHEFFLYNKKIGNLYDTFYDFTHQGQIEANDYFKKQVSNSEIKKSDPEKPKTKVPIDLKNKIDSLFDNDSFDNHGLLLHQSSFKDFIIKKRLSSRSADGVPQGGPADERDESLT